jgi:chromosome segregation ATPase
MAVRVMEFDFDPTTVAVQISFCHGSYPMIADITFECSHCGQRIAVGADAVGLEAECPACKTKLTVPTPDARAERSSRSNGTDRTRASDPASLREQLAAAQSECERLHANATHAQAEIKSFQNERIALRAEIASLKQRSATLESQLADVELESEVQRQRLAASATQLEANDAELVRLRAAETADATARNDLEHALAAAHSELAAAQAELKKRTKALSTTKAALKEAEANSANWQARCESSDAELVQMKQQFASMREEVESLRGLLDASETGRELAAARAQLAAHENDQQRWQQRVNLLEADLRNVAAQSQRYFEEAEALRHRLQDALQEAEAASDEKAREDNAVLRGIISRQNVELEIQHQDLKRLKRARFALRLVYAVFVVGLLGALWFAAQFVPQLRSLFEP